MKKICFVIPRAYYLFNPNIQNISDKIGGVQKQTYLLSMEIAKNNDFDVNFIVADFGQNDIENYDNIKVWRSFNFNDNILKRFKNLIIKLKKVDADIYIFSASDLGTGVFINLTKIFLKKKIIYMIAADAETDAKSHIKITGKLGYLLMKNAYKIVDKITAQSIQQYNLFLQNYKRKPDTIIKNIINIENHNKKILRDKILWIGRLVPIKNPELFINLAKKHPIEKFIMLAPIVHELVSYGTNLKSKIEKVQNIEYLDFVKPNEINKLYQQSKMYVMTSDSEGFSNTMLEAIANYCPILSYKVNNDNIFSDKKIGLCADANIDNFYNFFNILNDNFYLSPNFVENCIFYINKNHSIISILENFIKLLN